MTAKPLPLLIAGAAKAVVNDVARGLAAEGRFVPELVFDTVGALRDRVLSGEAAAATILSHEALDKVRASGFGRGVVLDLGTTGVGLGQRPGLPARPIDTPERFREALLSARSIAYADPARGATAGRHFRALVDRIGLAGELADRLKLYPFGVDGITALAKGEVDLAVSQATEIVTVPAVTFLGFFPEPYALSTGYGALALDDSEGAAAFMARMASPEAKAGLARAGFY